MIPIQPLRSPACGSLWPGKPARTNRADILLVLFARPRLTARPADLGYASDQRLATSQTQAHSATKKPPRRQRSAPPSPALLLPSLLTLVLISCVDVVPEPSAFTSHDGGAPDAADTGENQDVVAGDSATADATQTDAETSDAVTDSATVDPDAAANGDAATNQDGKTAATDDAISDDAVGDAGSADTAAADPCAGKKDKDSCDDGDACTTTYCDKGQCVVDQDLCECKISSDCSAKDDGDLCNGTLYCDTAAKIRTCKTNPATVVNCAAADNPCTLTSCDKKKGVCSTVAVSDADPKKPCEDGNKCTAADVCVAGVCTAGVIVCTCVKQADCAAQEDGNACNGTLFCDNSGGKPTCKLNPASLVTCQTVGNSTCTKTACDVTTGKCGSKTLQDNAACEDGNPCTSGDTCKAGSCQPGADLCQCKTAADCAKFDDGNACNGVPYCHGPTGTCKPNPKTIVHCKAGTPCAPVACNPKSGTCEVKLTAKFSNCNADGNPCTVDDTCDGKGVCTPGTDVCVCEKNDDCDKQDDNNACNGTLYCDKLAKPPTCKPNPKTIVTCAAAASPCQVALCAAGTGKCETSNLADFSPCDDGDKCTVGDVCEAGKCSPGPDLCKCASDNDCLDDGDLCNGVPYCDKAATPTVCKLKTGSSVTCSAKLSAGCLVGQCAAKTGACSAIPSTEKCDDKNPCTVDMCDAKSGKCTHQALVDGTSCDDVTPAAKFCKTSICNAAPLGMVLIPATTLPMGCNAALDAGCDADEKPQHEVKLTRLWIDRFEVTVEQYAACVKLGNCDKSSGTAAGCNHDKPNRTTHPANCVSHVQAQAYCKHATKRLPTEAEWELAARGGCSVFPTTCSASQPLFPWALPLATCKYAVLKSDAGDGCGLGTTRAVGTWILDDSPFGVRDMGGNVAEWVADWYAADYYVNSPVADPPGPSTATTRVVRGGHFQANAAAARAGNRTPRKATDAAPSIGFRCAKDVAP